MPRRPTTLNKAPTTSPRAACAASPTDPPQLLQITAAAAAANSSTSSSPRAAGPQACAACKYQRRKCTPDCPLAAYFPAEQERRFLDAHRLFGVSNIQKTLRDTKPELRQDAMRALIYQAEARASDPVGGCWRITRDLEVQLKYLLSFLSTLHSLLLPHRQQRLAGDTGMLLPAVPDHGGAVDVDQQYVLTDNQMQPPAQHQPHDIISYAGEQDLSRHAQRQYGSGAADLSAGSSGSTFGEEMERYCQIDTDAFDMSKPDQSTNATMLQHAGNGSTDEEIATAPAVVESEADQAASSWQMEIGFSFLDD